MIIVCPLDPAAMSQETRMAEIAGILARAYLRLKFSRKESNSLDVPAQDTALCVPPANEPRAGSEEAA